MKYLSSFLFNVSVLAFLPVVANAAGTYYTGYYRSPQQNYSNQTYAQRQTTNYSSSRSYTTPSYSSTRYNQYNNQNNTSNQQNQSSSSKKSDSNSSGKTSDSGFWLNAGLSRESAMWQFEMKESGSVLHYDNVAWNVLDINGGYAFEVGKTKMQIDAGFKYGMQAGENTMVDDDVSNGGYFITQWVDAEDNSVIGDEIGHALSIGTSQGGSMMNFNVGFGLEDFFTVGKVKMTPSIGYRYLKYKLETEKNYGLSVDTAACFEVNGEIQCDPAIVVDYGNGTQQIIWRDDINNEMTIASGASYISTGGTYYYQQPGVSHSYDVAWAGPYFAMDMDYIINQNNAVNGRIELGLPSYSATGDQPYRFDWQHPKSIEDEAGIGSAFHFGLGANWTTAITDSVALSIGLTYDYYSVSDADAKTYLNEAYYTDLYNAILNSGSYADEDAMLDPETGSAVAINIKNLEKECPGWVCSAKGEIESFYKSMGIRVGINALF